MRLIFACALAAGMLFSAVTHAQTSSGPLLWHDESLTYLYGKQFKIDPAIQQTFTFEHTSGWTFGDLFVFLDQYNYNGKGHPDNGSSSYYGEITPRLSLGKLTGRSLGFGPVTDVLLAATYEFGEGDVEAYLLGPAIDLNIPGFDFFQLNVFYRKPDGHRAPSGAWQITPVWSYTLPMGRSDIVIDGYIDWVVNNRKASSNRRHQSDYHANFHFNPQVKYDLGKALGYNAKSFYVGIEYDYWSDKYGIKDSHYFPTDQNTFSLLLKYHF